MKNILVLTPIYPADDLSKGATPVVHYFTKEWVNLGYNVVVVHYEVNFPRFVYMLVKPFKSLLETKNGFVIRTFKTKYREYELDGVSVCRIPLTKLKPHARLGEKQIKKGIEKTLDFCKKNDFLPDVIVSHWINPCFEIMHKLKKIFSVPTCYVAHDCGEDLLRLYKKECSEYIQETNVIGYRSRRIKDVFERVFHCMDKPNFMCYSGIPQRYISSVGSIQRTFKNVSKFIYVGTLIQRKFPAEIIPALSSAFDNDNFNISYVGGSGNEQKKILDFGAKYNCIDKIHLFGRVNRDSVIALLKQSDVFVMISKKETFGLVYLEAMAVGCITIASKNEGFDGIIEDGVNGFLCESGNGEELAEIIKKIRKMTAEELSNISTKAIETAWQLTDVNVAIEYLNNIKSVCCPPKMDSEV